MVDARLADGSRVNVVIPPLAIDGPALSIRRFGASRPGPDELVELGDADRRASASCWRRRSPRRRSVLVSGGTGSGKTTLLNALSSFIAPGERVVTIEDAAELRLQQPHVVRLESRPAGVEGRGEVTIRDLLRNALRMRPDRIVIGEVRGAGGARPADRAQHRPRRRALDRPRQLARRRAAPARDAGADGRRGAAARGDRRAGRGAGSTSSSTSSATADGARRVTEIAEVARGRGGRRCASSGGASERRRSDRRRAGAPAPAGWRALAAREAVLAQPGAGALGRRALEPLRRAGREGYAPDRARAPPARGARDRRGDPRPAGSWPARRWRCRSRSPGPAAAAWAIAQPPPRYRRAVERGAAGGRDRGRRLAQRRALAAGLAAGRGRLARRARRRSSWRGSAPSSTSARRPRRRSRRWRRRMRSRAGRRLRRRAAQPAARRRRPRRAAAPLRRRRRRARPGRRGRPLGDRPGPLHRPARRRDADAAAPSSPSCSQPGFLAGLLGSPRPRRCCSPLAAALQLAGFVAIRRLSRVVG